MIESYRTTYARHRVSIPVASGQEESSWRHSITACGGQVAIAWVYIHRAGQGRSHDLNNGLTMNRMHFDNELQRLRAAPRYQIMISTLLGFPIKCVDAHSFICMASEIFLQHVYKFSSPSPSPYIIDGGANIGLSIAYFKQLYPEAEVLAFEPDRLILPILNENVALYSHVTVMDAALWSSAGTMEFKSEGSWAGRLCQPGDPCTYLVRTARLRDYLDRPVDLVKLDIEGAENDVLFDSFDRLHYVKHLFVEHHSFAGQKQKLAEVLSLLGDLGFRVFIQGYREKHPFLREEKAANEIDLVLNIFAAQKGCFGSASKCTGTVDRI
jgi:FkbM family methyltransferase